VTLLYGTLAVVATQRLVELAWAGRNTARLRRLGAIETDAGGHLGLITLHAAWLATLALLVPAATPPAWVWLGFFALLQPARIWVIVSLGHFWTTRVVSLPGAPLVKHGPYRWVRHPNYLIVAAEIAALPLAFGAYALAAVFSILNLALTLRRVTIENRLLAARRRL
jgi:methyltransferase